MNISKAFVDYMQSAGFGTFGTDLFIGSVPLSAPDAAWWIASAGGIPINKTETGEMMKQYILTVYYRNTRAEEVYNRMQAFEETINSLGCYQMGSFDTIESEATIFAADQDIDQEDRTVGLAQVTITTYSN